LTIYSNTQIVGVNKTKMDLKDLIINIIINYICFFIDLVLKKIKNVPKKFPFLSKISDLALRTKGNTVRKWKSVKRI